MFRTNCFRASCQIANVFLLTMASSAFAQEKDAKQDNNPLQPGRPAIQQMKERATLRSSAEPQPVPTKNDQPEQTIRNSQSLFAPGFRPAAPAGTSLETLQHRMQELKRQQQQVEQEFERAQEAVRNSPGVTPAQPPGAPPLPPLAPSGPGGWNPQAAGLLPPAPMAATASEGDFEKQALRQQLQAMEAQLQELATQERMRSAAPLPDDATLRAFALKYVRPQDIAQALHNITGGGGPRIAVDERTNALLLAGNDKQISVAEQLVKTLDQPGKETQSKTPETLQLRIVWVIDGLPDTEGKPLGVPIVSPQVMDALGQLGFDATRVVCQQLATLTVQDNRAGNFHFEVPVMIGNQQWQFRGQGTVAASSGERYALTFDLLVQQPNAPQNSQLGGSIFTPLGHYTVMGTTTFVESKGNQQGPIQAKEQHASAFVVYLDRAPEFAAGAAQPAKESK